MSETYSENDVYVTRNTKPCELTIFKFSHDFVNGK